MFKIKIDPLKDKKILKCISSSIQVIITKKTLIKLQVKNRKMTH